MKRFFTVLAVVALMAMMLVGSSLPVFAAADQVWVCYGFDGRPLGAFATKEEADTFKANPPAEVRNCRPVRSLA